VQIYNCPRCDDVYHDIKIDYRSKDVNATNFLSVLAGDSVAMEGVGTGRVIASGPNDRVFVYYTDHGASGNTKHTSVLSPLPQHASQRRLSVSPNLEYFVRSSAHMYACRMFQACAYPAAGR
jgi:hypothetical protein